MAHGGDPEGVMNQLPTFVNEKVQTTQLFENEKLNERPDEITKPYPHKAVCLLDWAKDGKPIGTGFLAFDKDTKKMFWMSAGHNLVDLDLNPGIPNEKKISLKDFRVRFNRTADEPVEVERKQGTCFILFDLLQDLQYDEDNIQFERGSDGSSLVPDYFIAPLHIEIEAFKRLFKNISYITISDEFSTLDHLKPDIHILGHPISKNESCIQRHPKAKQMLNPVDLEQCCTNEDLKNKITTVNKIFYTLSTQEGNSGSPVLYFRQNEWKVVGIHGGGMDKGAFGQQEHVNYAEMVIPIIRNLTTKTPIPPPFGHKPPSASEDIGK